MKIIIDNNSLELHEELEKLGFCKLNWTTSTGTPNLKTCATDCYYSKNGMMFAYWNDGTSIEKIKSVGIVVCDTVEEFVSKARFMIKNEEYETTRKQRIV